MQLYTVHVPTDFGDEVSRADRTVFLREGFSRWAFVFGWLYLVWYRLWLAAALWIAVGVALAALATMLHLPESAVLVLVLLMHLFIGLEANDLRRWRLARKRYTFADVVAGGRRDDAEHVFFHRQPAEAPRSAALPVRVVARDTGPAVIGMFPDETG